MPSNVPLHSLGGQPAPDEIARDLALLLDLPPPRERACGRCSAPASPIRCPTRAEARLDAFCRAHEAPAESSPGPSRRAASSSGRRAPRPRARPVRRGPRQLRPSKEVADILLAGYDAARAQVRRELMRGALLDHGNVLEGVDWRVDHVTTSSRGGVLREPVGVLTLRYRAGGKAERLTLQLVPEALRELHEACESVVAAVARTR